MSAWLRTSLPLMVSQLVRHCLQYWIRRFSVLHYDFRIIFDALRSFLLGFPWFMVGVVPPSNYEDCHDLLFHRLFETLFGPSFSNPMKSGLWKVVFV